MNTFEFATATRVIFGTGRFKELPALSSSLGCAPLLIVGRTDRFALAATHKIFVAGEPTFDAVRQAAVEAKAAGCDHVVAIGGGSVLDTGKAIAMLLANGGDPLDYAEIIGAGRAISRPSQPLIAVPTTAGTGSEVTRNAVLASPESRVKVSLRSPHMLPAVALVDPDLAANLPPNVTAATGMDALSQLIEPFVCARSNPLVDALCRDGMARAMRALPRAFANGGDLAARSDMALAALFSGMALANAGLGAVHGFAGVIGGIFGAPHGAVCAALLGPVIRVNRRAARDRNHVAAMRFGELEQLAPVGQIERMAESFAIPRLGHYGVKAEMFDGVIEQALAASSMKANPIALTRDELREILQIAL